MKTLTLKFEDIKDKPIVGLNTIVTPSGITILELGAQNSYAGYIAPNGEVIVHSKFAAFELLSDLCKEYKIPHQITSNGIDGEFVTFINLIDILSDEEAMEEVEVYYASTSPVVKYKGTIILTLQPQKHGKIFCRNSESNGYSYSLLKEFIAKFKLPHFHVEKSIGFEYKGKI